MSTILSKEYSLSYNEAMNYSLLLSSLHCFHVQELLLPYRKTCFEHLQMIENAMADLTYLHFGGRIPHDVRLSPLAIESRNSILASLCIGMEVPGIFHASFFKERLHFRLVSFHTDEILYSKTFFESD